MDGFFALMNILAGFFMLLVGFKAIDLFGPKNEEKAELFHKKWGAFFKVGGIIVALLGLFRFYYI